MNVVERVALKLADELGENFGEAGSQEFWEGVARAVLRELREPSSAMVEAGDEVAEHLFVGAAGIFRAMIDKALEG